MIEASPKPRTASRRLRLARAFQVEWREVGILGRIALLGVAFSLIVAVALGFWIPSIVTRHLLVARADLIGMIGTEIASEGLVPVGPPDSLSYRAFDKEVNLRIVGGETVRVKLWSLDGQVLYSDDARLVGEYFALSTVARDALRGRISYAISDLADPAHAGDRDFGRLIEFYVPLQSAEHKILGLFEVEQRVDELRNTVGHVQRNVWLAIVTGLGVLGISMGALTLASARVVNRRRQQAERLLTSLFRVQEEERKRTVGALHDDVGQPLYRLLHGLEGIRARLGGDHWVGGELSHLEGLVREIEQTLRAELRLLHRGVQVDLDLRSALEDLVETTEHETDLHIDLTIAEEGEAQVNDAARIALLHAAREALTNVRKHAGAHRVAVSLSHSDGRVFLEVKDDGQGIDSLVGLGLTTTRERLQAIGGGLAVSGHRASGTRFRAWVPAEEGSEW